MSLTLQSATVRCNADGSIYFQFCASFSGAFHCCDVNSNLVQTSLVCGSSPVITYTYGGTITPGGDCDTLKNTLGYDNFKVML
jgi:hypothetical protein